MNRERGAARGECEAHPRGIGKTSRPDQGRWLELVIFTLATSATIKESAMK
jgi:hypothetical protein